MLVRLLVTNSSAAVGIVLRRCHRAHDMKSTRSCDSSVATAMKDSSSNDARGDAPRMLLGCA